MVQHDKIGAFSLVEKVDEQESKYFAVDLTPHKTINHNADYIRFL